MKRLLLLSILSILVVTNLYAQPRAIGARVGSGVEFSYQHTTGKNFVALDAGLIYGVMQCSSPTVIVNGESYHQNTSIIGESMVGAEVAFTYNWLFPFSSWKGKGSWNWYMGIGMGAGYNNEYAYEPLYGSKVRYSQDYGFVGAAGRIGFEYNFWFPFQLSLDWRPIIGACFGAVDQYTMVAFYTTGLYAGGICIGARYLF